MRVSQPPKLKSFSPSSPWSTTLSQNTPSGPTQLRSTQRTVKKYLRTQKSLQRNMATNGQWTDHMSSIQPSDLSVSLSLTCPSKYLSPTSFPPSLYSRPPTLLPVLPSHSHAPQQPPSSRPSEHGQVSLSLPSSRTFCGSDRFLLLVTHTLRLLLTFYYFLK